MRSLLKMETIQIEITNACVNQCSNCTRFVGHYKPWYMDFEYFKKAIDSMVKYPNMVGIQGGDPLLHPDFEKMCNYALSKIPRNQLGLWTTLPKGYEKYNEVICRTFKHILVNDHTRNDIYHHPCLVSIKDVIKDEPRMNSLISHCWAQESWSASINPNGAYFCEMAASFSMLYNDKETAWKIEPKWWERMPWDFGDQIRKFCNNCGMAASLKRKCSTNEIDDISISNYERLKDTSPKIKAGRYNLIQDPQEINPDEMELLAAYKDFNYRDKIAHRYGMFLTINEYNYWEPHLIGKEQCNTFFKPKISILEEIQEKYK